MTASDPASLCPLENVLGVLAFEGPDARAFLQGQLSSDVAALAPGRGQWTSYNSAKGRVLANFWLWQVPRPQAAERFGALVAADLAASIAKRLSMFVLRAKVTVADRTPAYRALGVAGAGAGAAVAAALGRAPAAGEAIVPDGVPAEAVGLPDGRVVVLVAAEAAADVQADLAARTTPGDAGAWRGAGIAAGVAWIGAATSDLFVPQMINWDVLNGVSFSKGCYPGQEVVARMRYLGRLKERLYRLHATADPPPAGTRIFSPQFDGQACGTVVDAVAATGGGTNLLAVLQVAAAQAPGLALATPDGPALGVLPLPYALPDVAAPRARLE